MTYLALLATCLALGGWAQAAWDEVLGYHEVPTEPLCMDNELRCGEWAKANQCIENSFYMLTVCPRSCKVAYSCRLPLAAQLTPWQGHATAHGTRMFATMYGGASSSARAGLFHRDPSMGTFYLPGQTVRGDPWLMLSSLGTGTYLGGLDKSTDDAVAASIAAAVHAGWNVIDTASNYRQGRGEVAVGRALSVLRGVSAISGIAGMTGREMIFLSTKAGFVAAAQAKALLQNAAISDADLVQGIHCIHPACLEASLVRSLTNMHVETVDLLYLHNAVEMLHTLGQPALMARFKAAFQWLEQARAQGRIRAYGLATWDCFRRPPGSSDYLQLKAVVALAEEVGGKDHGFRYVQLPLNARMPEAWRDAWQPLPQHGAEGRGQGKEQMGTLLEAASRLGVGVFASGPLHEGQLLADSAIQAHLQGAEELSNVKDFAPKLLQLARSTPLLTGAIVGHKTSAHVKANLQVGQVEPLTVDAFHRIQSDIAGL